MSVKTVGVAVEQTAYHFDKPFDYILPDFLDCENIVGRRVLVPFGKGSAERIGMVIYENALDKAPENLKRVTDVLDREPVLSAEFIKLGKYLSEQTFSPLYDCYKAFLPSGLNIRRSSRYFAAKGSFDVSAFPRPIMRIYRLLEENPKGMTREELLCQEGISPESLSKGVRDGLLIKQEDARQGVSDATVRTVRLCEGYDLSSQKLTEKQRRVVNFLADTGAATVKEICYFTGVGESVVKNAEKKGLLEIYDDEVYRTPEVLSGQSERITLSKEQQAAFDTFGGMLDSQKAGCGLLYGVTGSGKTKVYLELIEKTLKMGRQAIVMVPEISLTPQVLAAFKGRFGDLVAVFHSRLSMGERLDEWKRVKRGEAKIAVGTRSAVFAPFDRLGLIVMDEEQEHTYKSEASPRFHARDAARFRAAENGALLLLCSATPSVESFAKAKEGKYTLVRMTSRYRNAKLPKVETVDMREEMTRGNTSIISRRLLELLEQNLSRGKQSILLLNRRGYNTYISCKSCGKVMTCDNCSISMSYHRTNGRLVCHYCGASKPLPEKCPHCGGEFIKMSGVGTQFAEAELQKLLPSARILRLDADTTMAKNAHEKKLSDFSKGEYDILIGTQMVAKGLDFENVSLVGVLCADQSIYNSDFRAYERAFSLLTQVIGRAGRASGEGISVLQSFCPDNEVIEMASTQDYDAFFENEIMLRRALEYPPFCDICMLGFVSSVEREAAKTAKTALEILQKYVSEQYSDLTVRVLGPSPATVLKVGGKYRYRIIIKCKNTKTFRSCLSRVLKELGSLSGKTTVFADMNPEGIM